MTTARRIGRAEGASAARRRWQASHVNVDDGARRSHWVARAPAGRRVAWDAELVEERPNELIAWRSLDDADVRNAGTVTFERGPGGRGTTIRVSLSYAPPGGKFAAVVARLF